VNAQKRSLETRSRILETALLLFGQRGYDATGVAEICSAAAVSKGAFYHHFSSKQALFLDLLESWLQGVQGDLSGVLEEAPNMVEGLLGMAARTREVFKAADGRLSIFLEFWAQARKDPEVWRRAVEPLEKFRGIFAAIVTRGVQEGSLRPVDPGLVAQALVSMAVGLIMQGVFDPGGEEWERIAQDAIRLFIEGIGRRQ
jgi:AcrR family transcriptional regulator